MGTLVIENGHGPLLAQSLYKIDVIIDGSIVHNAKFNETVKLEHEAGHVGLQLSSKIMGISFSTEYVVLEIPEEGIVLISAKYNRINGCFEISPQNPKNQIYCPESNKKDDKVINGMVNTVYGIIAITVFWWLGTEFYNTTSLEEMPVPTIESYNDAFALDYRAAMLGNYQTGDQIAFTGEIDQAIPSSNIYMISSNKNEIFEGYAGERIWLEFTNKPDILEDDIINVYGRYYRTRIYKTVLGSEKEVPRVLVDYYERLE